MIARLTGTLASVGADSVVLDVNGVGYLVFCAATTARALPAAGEQASLLIETHVREDHIHLYGFAREAERAWFRALQSVQGVGARVALAILSVAPPGTLVQAISAQDTAPITEATGVGTKLAKRIVGELKDRAPVYALEAARAPVAGSGAPDDATAEDAVSALVNLGYGRSEAFSAVAAAGRALERGVGVEDLIKGGLMELGR